MRAITPRGKVQEEGASNQQNPKVNDPNSAGNTCPHPTTPKNLGKLSQASVPTPSTASTVDITANTTLESINFNTGNEGAEKDKSRAAEKTEPALPTSELWQVLDTQLRTNIGASVRCGICLSTVRDPIRTPCSHVFCRGCMSGYLRASGANACPECKTPCTKRSLETFSEMDEMADAYKGLLRAFGLAPGLYTPEITTMTQKIVSSFDHDNDDEGLDEEDSRRARLDRLCVSVTYQQKALPICFNAKACSKMQVEENEQVVQANFKACFDDKSESDAMQEVLELRLKSATRSNSKPESFSQALPNTQDVQEQAREQLEADREMQESIEAAEREAQENSSPKKQEDEAFFTLRKPKETAQDPFELPPQDQPSPPTFARADSGTKGSRAFKSFSKRDQSLERPSFGGEALSPIEHESSFWTLDAHEKRRASSSFKKDTSSLSSSSSSPASSQGVTNVTGMLEDSRGGLHMMPMSGHKNDETNGDVAESEYYDHNEENSDDQTIVMTLDDSPAFSRTSGDNDNGNENDNKDNNSRQSHQEGQTQDSKNSISSQDHPRDPFPLTYDPIGNPTEITEEYHESTKTEISIAVNPPAGQEQEEDEQLTTQKALFASNDDDRKIAARRGKKKRGRKNSKKPATASRNQPKKADNSCSDSEMSHPSRDSSEEFPKGTIVRVQSRTWPGVNKQGGVGRITGQNADGTYNVAYVLGGKESNIDAVFVSREYQEESEDSNNKRRRRAKDSLPEELLKQLAAEGFDIPGVKAKPKPKATAALVDATNNARTGSKRKRNASRSTSVEIAEDSKQGRGRRKQNPPLATKEDKDLPTTVKRVKQQASTKAKAARKTVTWSSNEPKRATRKKASPQIVDHNTIESDHEKAFEIADGYYNEKLEQAISDGKVVAVCSNLSEADNAIFHSLRSYQVLTSNDAVDEHTHLCVVPSLGSSGQNKSVASVRTLKVMMAALQGIPLVSPDWLKTCYLQKKIVVPEKFLRTIPTKNAVIKSSGDALCGVSRLAMAKSTQKNLLFDNMFVCLCGSYKGDTKTSLESLLEAGGAKIFSTSDDVEGKMQELVGTSKRISDRIVVVCGNSGRGASSGISLATPVKRQLRDLLKSQQQQEHDSKRAQNIVVDSQWVIESVTCAKAMAPNLFEPSILKDLWKLCL